VPSDEAASEWRFLAPAARDPVRRAEPPTFTVVIAAYQGAALIGEAVASALNQTRMPEDVIVCDDGSTDDLEAALAPYRDRITLLRQQHAGHAAALNRSVRAARGTFVSCLDQDDVFLPRRIEALANLASARPDLDILTTDEYLEADGRIVGRHLVQIPFPVDDQRVGILRAGFLGHPAVRRERLLACGGFDESFGAAADVECWTRLILAGARAGMVDEPLMHYRLHPGAMTANRAGALRERVRTLEKVAKNADLRPHERDVLERALAANRKRAMLAESEAALRGLLPDPRGRLLEVARTDLFTRSERLRALAAYLVPRLAQRWIERREKRTGFTYLERPMDRLLRSGTDSG
jgi:GT2 family glycosyltransferase